MIFFLFVINRKEPENDKSFNYKDIRETNCFFNLIMEIYANTLKDGAFFSVNANKTENIYMYVFVNYRFALN